MSRAHDRLRRRLSPALLRRSMGRSLGRTWRGMRSAAARHRRAALVASGLVVLTIVLGAGAFAASAFYRDYGEPRTPVSIATWAERAPRYLASDCRGCHSNVATSVAAAPHERLICETCHVPALDHPGAVAGVVVMLPAANGESCVACHEETQARPAAFAQVALTRHYATAACLRCHEPHTSIAVTPREVTHPLDRLPPCISCHAPDGLKQYPSNHQAAPDTECLACHRIGAGGP